MGWGVKKKKDTFCSDHLTSKPGHLCKFNIARNELNHKFSFCARIFPPAKKNAIKKNLKLHYFPTSSHALREQGIQIG